MKLIGVPGYQLLKKIVRNPEYYGLPGHTDVEYDAFSLLIYGLTCPDPGRRWSWKEVLDSKFVEGALEGK